MVEIDQYIQKLSYRDNLSKYSRRYARTVHVGDVPLGSDYPIRVQSMTTTNTMDTLATVEQSIRMIESGCSYIRITAPSIKEAENLSVIKKALRERGYDAPLIADIHFTPNAAELAARIVEKVRVNPGNYVDKKKFEQIEYTDSEYEAEIERIRKRFTPLVNICKEYGTAMRIGTNHGSLSDRIMSRYGDTPVGMVESAMEFLRICEDLNYHNIVLSMKASNPMVMIQAYRLLLAKMESEDMHYPLHLGVTEAGDGEEGRVKSAVGIGSLLEDGIGDTVRVSLTEEPEVEGPVAQKLIDQYQNRHQHKAIYSFTGNYVNFDRQGFKFCNPYIFERRKSYEVQNIGNKNVPRVIISLDKQTDLNEQLISALDYHHDPVDDKWNMGDMGADYVYLGDKLPGFMLPGGLKAIYNYNSWEKLADTKNAFPLLDAESYLNESNQKSESLNFLEVKPGQISKDLLDKLKSDSKVVLIINTDNAHGMAEQRQFFYDLAQIQIDTPVIISRSYNEMDRESFLLKAATDCGSLIADGFGDGIWLRVKNITNAPNSLLELKLINRCSFNILQATRARISRTEYISCPSCGRTLFDLQETTAAIRKETDHLKGVKIGIMGCIVNGPGEMADADYGYVGTGPDKITLYKNKEVVKRNVQANNAINELIGLIKEDGKWREPT